MLLNSVLEQGAVMAGAVMELFASGLPAEI